MLSFLKTIFQKQSNVEIYYSRVEEFGLIERCKRNIEKKQI
jgi:hypothetical protein